MTASLQTHVVTSHGAEARLDTWSRIPAETRRDLLLWDHPGQNLSEADLLYLARIRADEIGPGGAP